MRTTSEWLRAAFDDYNSVCWLEPFSMETIHGLLWTGMIAAKRALGWKTEQHDEDCVQNGFIYLHRKAPRYNGQVKPETYVGNCGRWATLDWLCSVGRRREDANLDGLRFEWVSRHLDWDEKIDREICLDELFRVADGRMKIILQLRMRGESMQKIGARLGISEPRVSQLLTRFKREVQATQRRLVCEWKN